MIVKLIITKYAQSKGISNFSPTPYRISQFISFRLPQSTDTIVYIDGAFDLFHLGHIETLKRAKQLGTFLYVGIHDDSTVNKYHGSYSIIQSWIYIKVY